MDQCAGLRQNYNRLDPKTKIIFATAHSQYMSDAFELYAYDYLVKPFNIDRVNQTLWRIKSMSEVSSHNQFFKIVKYERGLDKLLVKGKEYEFYRY